MHATDECARLQLTMKAPRRKSPPTCSTARLTIHKHAAKRLWRQRYMARSLLLHAESSSGNTGSECVEYVVLVP